MPTIINTKLGTHRGKRRIWIEGRKLAREGYAPGMKYRAEVTGHRVVLRVSEDGGYTVSRRTRGGSVLPIIDLGADDVTRVFDGVPLLRVAIKCGCIVITAHTDCRKATERVTRLVEKLQAGKPLDVVSLFHGGGVLDKALHAGFAAAGVKTRLAAVVEQEGAYLEASLANNPELWDSETVALQSPIEAVRFQGAPQADVVTAGIPCTGASRAGRSKNKLVYAEDHASAGALFVFFLEAVRALNPAVVVLENVPEYAHTASMAVIRSVLATLHYRVSEREMGGNEFGCLERRRRLCVVALADGLPATFDVSQVMPDRTKEATLAAILEDVPADSPRWKAFDYLAAKADRDAAAGKGFARQLLTAAAERCGTIGRHYAKCRSTEPFLIDERDPARSRLLTPAEHARVKGVPEGVIAGLSDTMAHQVLGQSVIYPAFRALGRALGGYFDAVLPQGAHA